MHTLSKQNRISDSNSLGRFVIDMVSDTLHASKIFLFNSPIENWFFLRKKPSSPSSSSILNF